MSQFEEHCSVLEANIATVQQRINNEDDDGWMDEDQEGDDHRHVIVYFIAFCYCLINFLLNRIQVETVRRTMILLMLKERNNGQCRPHRIRRKRLVPRRRC